MAMESQRVEVKHGFDDDGNYVEIEIDPELELEESEDPMKLMSQRIKRGTLAEGFSAQRAGPIEACSDRKREVFVDRTGGFMLAVYAAFNWHIPLCIGPDDIWTLVIQGVSKHIELNAEQLRSKFVDFDGKKTLRIRRDGFVKGSPTNDWAGCFKEWSQLITKFIGEDNRKNLVPEFSTTGALETALHELALMDCMKSYFDFRCGTFCGISKVKLRGSLDDWKNLRKMLDGLRQYDLDWWIDHLVPIIDKIIKTYEGEADKIFWYTIYKQWSTHGSGASTYVNGWVTTFFPYINERKRSQFASLEYLREIATAKPPPQTDEFRWGPAHNEPYQGRIDIADVPCTMSKTPFVWEYHGAEIPMSIYGGFPGCEMDGEYVRPVLGWAVGPSEKEKKKQNDDFW